MANANILSEIIDIKMILYGDDVQSIITNICVF